MLSHITPVILTFNEAPNLARTLACLEWAERVVIVDSGSTDETREIARRCAKVSWFERRFDTQADQWRYAIAETAVDTPWVLRLDADYLVPEALVGELSRLAPGDDVAAYRARFDYAICGRKLRASLYPPNTVLFRPDRVSVRNSGHTERWQVTGRVEDLSNRIVHDDRKPLSRWFASQARYMALETTHLEALARDELRPSDRLRRIPLVMPVLSFLYCLVGKGLVLDGRAGLHYATQRLVAEAMLSLMILDRRLRKER
jgi:glycosyltransferase involved in cell wall biosynthesis